jgi:hypothetical protein
MTPFTRKRPYRCVHCGWRGWAFRLPTGEDGFHGKASNATHFPGDDSVDLATLDVADTSPPRHSPSLP